MESLTCITKERMVIYSFTLAMLAVAAEPVPAPRAEPVSFRREVMAVFSISGCNAGSCHGLPSGRGGFRLSLWGQDPAEDYLQLTRDTLARRVDRLDPDASLILKKALGRVPHEGGRRFAPDSLQARTLRAWVA